jgi:hypothetical protein
MPPAMAAGITDHLGTVGELLSYRVSPLYWQEQPLLEKLFPVGLRFITEVKGHYHRFGKAIR